jgi:hypothetical protein
VELLGLLALLLDQLAVEEPLLLLQALLLAPTQLCITSIVSFVEHLLD